MLCCPLRFLGNLACCSSVQFSSVAQVSQSFTIFLSLLKLMSSSWWCYPTISSLSLSSPALNLSQKQSLFQQVSSSHQVAKVLELQLQHRPPSECSGLVSFKIDWFDLLAIQGSLKSLLQHHNLKASIFGIQISLWSIIEICCEYQFMGSQIVGHDLATEELTTNSYAGKNWCQPASNGFWITGLSR